MVHVTIRDVAVRKGEFVIDMVVSGNVQPDSKGVMDFLTRFFSKLEFDCTRCTDPQLAKLGYYFDDLAREKVFIARIPENTNILLENLEDAVGEAVRRGEDVVHLFVDAGSPLKHVYIVKVRRASDGYHITVRGLGYAHHGDIYILMDLIPREEDGGEIHVEVSHSMGKNKRALLRRALFLAAGAVSLKSKPSA
jgi:hypothetical protein